MTESNYFLEAEDGTPLGVINFDLITEAGCALAFRMAAHCDDPIAMDAIAADVLTEVGTDTFGYVAACALRLLAEQVLNPALTAGEAAGVHLRDGLLAIAEGRDPMTTAAEPPSRRDMALAVIAAEDEKQKARDLVDWFKSTTQGEVI